MATQKTAPVDAAEESAPSKYQVIHLKYRPQTISEVVGQRSVVRQLQGDIKDNRVGTAYLFTGPRGVGKTSMARIFAKALNCVQGPTPEPCGKCVHCIGIANDSDLDVIEVDAATYTKKDETVELLEGIDRAAFNSRYKVYIIDEVHMFSVQSFNVLLKRLEEPPPHVVFILATTNPEKIPETVISRCRRLEFERMEATDIVGRLSEIADRENVVFEEGERDRVLEAIALSSDGGMRDSQVALDQLISLGEGRLGIEAARQLLGIVESDLLQALLVGLVQRDAPKCLLLIRDLVDKGRDLHRFIKTFTVYLRDAMMLRAGAPVDLLKVSRAHPEELARAVEGLSFPALMNFVQQFLELEEKMRTAAPARFLLEFTVIKLTAIHPRFVLDQLGNASSAPPLETPAPARAAAPAPSPGASIGNTMAMMKPIPPVKGPINPGAGASMPQAALLREAAQELDYELPDVEVGEEYPEPEVVAETRSPFEMLEEFRQNADRALSPSVAVISQSEVYLEGDDTICICVPNKIAVVAPMLERPEHLSVLRRVASESMGRTMRFKTLVAEASAEPAVDSAMDTAMSMESESDEAIEIEPLAPMEIAHLATDASSSASETTAKPRSLGEAMARFPDFREAIELIRKHCGADPLLYNGQRI